MPISSTGLTLLKRTVIGALLLSKFKNCEHPDYLRDFYSVVPNHDKDHASIKKSHKLPVTCSTKKFPERLVVLTVF